MDFGLSEEQQALRDLARKLLVERATPEAQGDLELRGEAFDRELWRALASSELLGLALPAEHGGGSLGLLEVCLLLEEAGRAAAPVPLFPALVLGAAPIGRFGSPDQQRRFLPPLISGEQILTAALVDDGPPVLAQPDGAGFRLNGARECVPALALAAHVLVPARIGSTTAIFIVDPRQPGAKIAAQIPTNSEPLGRLELTGARLAQADVLGDLEAGAATLHWMLEHAQIGLSALALGAAERALELTAKYATERRQFDRPIGTFQAVSQRAADAYVDVETMRLTLWRAAWLLAEGRSATAEVAVAKYWAAEAGHRVVNAAQHIHGGIGFDRDYPLHRHFLWERQIEFTLGSANRQLARLGALIAASAE
jgi:3-oxocholest-4-en-26-oyl-CoA dehydrogenase beta subunit